MQIVSNFYNSTILSSLFSTHNLLLSFRWSGFYKGYRFDFSWWISCGSIWNTFLLTHSYRKLLKEVQSVKTILLRIKHTSTCLIVNSNINDIIWTTTMQTSWPSIFRRKQGRQLLNLFSSEKCDLQDWAALKFTLYHIGIKSTYTL